LEYLLYGYYGHGNFGDDLLLRAMIEGIRAREPAASFNIYCRNSVAGYADDLYVRFTGIARYTESIRKRPWRLIWYFAAWIRWLGRSDVLVIGGGTLFIDKGRFSITLALLYAAVLLAKTMGKRVVIAGVGVDRLTNRASKWLTQRIFNAAEFVAVREEAAFAYVPQGTREHTKLAADLVLGLELDNIAPPTRTRQAVGLCFIDYFRTVESSERSHAAYEAAIFSLVERYRGTKDFACITFQRGIGQRDDWLVPRWLKRFPEHSVLHVDSIDSARTAIAAVDVIVTTRFHLGLLGIMWGRAVIAIDHELKMASLAEDFRLPGIPIEDFISRQDVDLDSLLTRYDKATTARCLAAQRERVALNFAWLRAGARAS
jgi:polysaccharide pyruvyl transferase WcaK-like protein